MLPLKLYDLAEAEFAEGILWYEKEEPGLGTRFRLSVEDAFSQIQHRPFAFNIIKRSDVRRILVSRFPYIIIYRVEDDSIVVISVFHTSRDPEVWKERLN